MSSGGKGTFFVGLSGYSYKPWQGEDRFYPPELKAKEFLGYYASRYPAVEMDGSWYKTPTKEAIAAWIEQTPDNFRFSFKVHRRISHLARLKPECYEGVKYLCKRLSPMGAHGRLGPMLVQLPPNLKKDEERLRGFVDNLPTTYDGMEEYQGPSDVAIHWGVEFRHPSWNCDEIAEILRSKNVAWVASDTDELPATRRDTASFMHARIRRTDTDEKVLNSWADYFGAAVQAGKNCFVYCKHEDEGSPWEWADYLRERIDTLVS